MFFDTLINNAAGIYRDSIARQENFRYGEQAAENADKRTRALYGDLYSPEAQMRQIKAAGLSPSIYSSGGLGGISGQAGAQGTGAAGISPSGVYGTDPLTLSQIKLNDAQARDLNASADEKEGKNPSGEAKIADIWANVGATKAAEELTKAQTTYQNVMNDIATKTKETQIWRIDMDARKSANEAERAFWEAKEKRLEWKFDKKTFENRVKQEAEKLANLIANESLTWNEAEKFCNDIFYSPDYAEAAMKNADAYVEYAKSISNNLPQQIELRKKELGVEKWKIGVNGFTELVRAASYFVGASQLGDGGYTMDETWNNYDKNGNPKGFTNHKSTKTRIPRIR